MFDLLIGLVAVMVANFFLGTNLAKLKNNFDKKKMTSGLLKIGGIVLGIVSMLVCAYSTQDIIVANINSQNMNLLDAMKAIIISIITYYGAQDITKLVNIFKVKVPVKEKTEEKTISIPEKNIIKLGDNEYEK